MTKKYKMKSVMLRLTEETLQLLDTVRGSVARGSYVEAVVWRQKKLQEIAKELGIENPQRPLELRGGDRRSEAYHDEKLEG